jgi:HSP20 family protein
MAKSEIFTSPQTAPARPRDVFSTMRDELDRMFERLEHGWPHWPAPLRRAGQDTPELDVRDSANAIVVEVELPGVDAKDVSVTLANGVLTITGEKKQEKQEKGESYYLAERSFGRFERAVRLPDMIDEARVAAKFDNGVLRVTAQKRPETVKAERRIEVNKA